MNVITGVIDDVQPLNMSFHLPLSLHWQWPACALPKDANTSWRYVHTWKKCGQSPLKMTNSRGTLCSNFLFTHGNNHDIGKILYFYMWKSKVHTWAPAKGIQMSQTFSNRESCSCLFSRKSQNALFVQWALVLSCVDRAQTSCRSGQTFCEFLTELTAPPAPTVLSNAEFFSLHSN